MAHVEAAYALEQRLLGIICWTISHDAQIEQMLRNIKCFKKEMLEIYRILRIRVKKVKEAEERHARRKQEKG